MKVALVTAFPRDPTAPLGGVEAVSVNLASGLTGMSDVELHVVTADKGATESSVSQWHGMTIHRLVASDAWTLIEAIGPGRRSVSGYVERLGPDVIHAHDVYGLMVKGMPIPRVFTIHGFIHADTLVSGERFARLRSWIWRRVEMSGWAEQPHIISINPYVRERLAGIATGVIHDIDNPIAKQFFDIPRAERKGVIFCAALICPRKNTLGLVDAFGRLKARGCHATLRLAGRITDEAYGRQVVERIRALGMDDRVVLLGSISRQQIGEELAAAGIFALVSLEEGSPMGIEEAMAVGVPVVTSNRCGMPYLVRDGETGYLVDPNDPEEIASRFELLLRDDSLRANMGESGGRIARDRFHPASVARRTKEVYERAVQKHTSNNGRADRSG